MKRIMWSDLGVSGQSHAAIRRVLQARGLLGEDTVEVIFPDGRTERFGPPREQKVATQAPRARAGSQLPTRVIGQTVVTYSMEYTFDQEKYETIIRTLREQLGDIPERLVGEIRTRCQTLRPIWVIRTSDPEVLRRLGIPLDPPEPEPETQQ